MIKIDKDYSLGADGTNSYVLVKGEVKTIVDKKTGKERLSMNVVGYFASLSKLLQSYLDIKLKQRIDDNTLTTLKELLAEIKAQKAVLKELLNTEIK